MSFEEWWYDEDDDPKWLRGFCSEAWNAATEAAIERKDSACDCRWSVESDALVICGKHAERHMSRCDAKVAAERERCAKVAEETTLSVMGAEAWGWNKAAKEIAAAIRKGK
jgi:hypothetical protein